MKILTLSEPKKFLLKPLRLKSHLNFLVYRLSMFKKLVTKLQFKGHKRFILLRLLAWFTSWQRTYYLGLKKEINGLDVKLLTEIHSDKLEFINYLKTLNFFLLPTDIIDWRLDKFNILFRIDNPNNNLTPYIRYLAPHKRSYYALFILSIFIKLLKLENKSLAKAFSTIIPEVLINNTSNNPITSFKVDIYKNVIYRHQ